MAPEEEVGRRALVDAARLAERQCISRFGLFIPIEGDGDDGGDNGGDDDDHVNKSYSKVEAEDETFNDNQGGGGGEDADVQYGGKGHSDGDAAPNSQGLFGVNDDYEEFDDDLKDL